MFIHSIIRPTSIPWSVSILFPLPIHSLSDTPLCTVGDYFKCVSSLIDNVRESGTARKWCLPPCETVQFTAWQVRIRKEELEWMNDPGYE